MPVSQSKRCEARSVVLQPRRSKEDVVSAKINTGSPTANMFGLEPCPKCGGRFRWPSEIEAICDHCGFREKLAEADAASPTRTGQP